MDIVIKKRISLEFLGEEYKDSYLIVKSVSVAEYEQLKKSEETVEQEVIKRVLEGEIDQDGERVKITTENVRQLSGEVFIRIWDEIMGGEPSPKVGPQ